MSRDTARAEAMAKHDGETGQATPDTLREQIAKSLAAGDTGSGAHWVEMSEAQHDLYLRFADHALFVVQPLLDAKDEIVRVAATLIEERDKRIADALDAAVEMRSQLVNGPELDDVFRIIAVLTGGNDE